MTNMDGRDWLLMVSTIGNFLSPIIIVWINNLKKKNHIDLKLAIIRKKGEIKKKQLELSILEQSQELELQRANSELVSFEKIKKDN